MRIVNNPPEFDARAARRGLGIGAGFVAAFCLCASLAQAADFPPAPAAGAITHIDDTRSAADISKSLTAAEDRASENAKEVVQKLDSNSATTTIEDLNTAKQAVERLNAMIEVEKHLAELEKVRSERGNGGHSNLASAIPASALTPPPAPLPLPISQPSRANEEMSKPAVIAPPKSSMEISRIIGSNGKYTAVLKVGGDIKNVQVGDTVDGGTVRWISPSSVQIDENGINRVLHVKNFGVVYSAMR